MGFKEDLASLYEAAGVGTRGTTILLSSIAKVPPTLPSGGLLTIVDTPGMRAEETHNEVEVPAFERPSVQVVARGRTYPEAEELARRAYRASRVRNTTVTVWYREITPVQPPFDLGVDGVGHPRCAFNVTAFQASG